MLDRILKLNLTRHDYLKLSVLVFAFLLLRLTNLTSLPIFTDEAIYLRWAQLMYDDPGLRFISLADGKQPLQMWVSGFFMLFLPDQLWAGRFPLVLCGLISMIGLYLVSWELFRNKFISFLTATLYLLAPPFMLHDRLGMADTMLAMWGILAVYLNLVLLRTRRLDISLLLGFVYGAGFLTKSPALFFVLLSPTVLLLLSRLRSSWSDKLHEKIDTLFHHQHSERLQFSAYAFWRWSNSFWRTLAQYLTLLAISIILGLGIASLMRLSELYYMIGQKELTFVVPFSDWLTDPFGRLLGNMTGMSTWFKDYLGWPLTLITIFGAIYGLWKRDLRILFLLLIGLTPWLLSASRAIVLYPRYLLYFLPQFLIIAAYGLYIICTHLQGVIRGIKELTLLDTLKFSKPQERNLVYAVISAILLISLAYPAYSTLMLNIDPTRALLPLQDRGQYIEDTPSGYGVPEIIDFLRSEYAKQNKLVVGTEGTFGLMPYALQIEFRNEILANQPEQPDVYIEGYWPFTHVPQRIMELAVDRPAYFVVYQYQGDIPSEMPLELVKEIQKPGNRKTIRLYKVKPQRYFPTQQFQLIP